MDLQLVYVVRLFRYNNGLSFIYIILLTLLALISYVWIVACLCRLFIYLFIYFFKQKGMFYYRHCLRL